MIKVVPLGLVAAAFLMSFFAFDQLVRLEYCLHRADWISDGMPQGVFWVPSEARALRGWVVKPRSSWALRRCWFTWLFTSPRWAKTDKTTKRALFRWRLLVAVSNIGFVLLVYFMFLRSVVS